MDRTAYFKARFERLGRISCSAYNVAAEVSRNTANTPFCQTHDSRHPVWTWKGSVERRVKELKGRMLRRYQATRQEGESPILDASVSWCPCEIDAYAAEQMVVKGTVPSHLKATHDEDKWGDNTSLHPLVIREVESWEPLLVACDSESSQGWIYCGREKVNEVLRRLKMVDRKARPSVAIFEPQRKMGPLREWESYMDDIDQIEPPLHLKAKLGYVLAQENPAKLNVPKFERQEPISNGA